jgi:hypothetical protein
MGKTRPTGIASFLGGRWVLIFLVLETVYFCFRSEASLGRPIA